MFISGGLAGVLAQHRPTFLGNFRRFLSSGVFIGVLGGVMNRSKD